MFIALTTLMAVRSGGAPYALDRTSYIPLLTERRQSEYHGYKHVAPPEQEPLKPVSALGPNAYVLEHARHTRPVSRERRDTGPLPLRACSQRRAPALRTSGP